MNQLAALLLAGVARSWGAAEPRPHVAVRGIYGGVPREVLDSGRSLAESTGVTVFAWSGLRKQPERIEAIGRAFREMRRRE